MLVIKINGIYYFRWSGMSWFLRVGYWFLCRALATPEPGMHITVQLSNVDRNIIAKRRIWWNPDRKDWQKENET